MWTRYDVPIEESTARLAMLNPVMIVLDERGLPEYAGSSALSLAFTLNGVIGLLE